MFSNIDEADCCNVDGDEFSNRKVNKVQNEMRELVRESRIRLFAVEVIGEQAGQVPENDLALLAIEYGI